MINLRTSKLQHTEATLHHPSITTTTPPSTTPPPPNPSHYSGPNPTSPRTFPRTYTQPHPLPQTHPFTKKKPQTPPPPLLPPPSHSRRCHRRDPIRPHPSYHLPQRFRIHHLFQRQPLRIRHLHHSTRKVDFENVFTLVDFRCWLRCSLSGFFGVGEVWFGELEGGGAVGFGGGAVGGCGCR